MPRNEKVHLYGLDLGKITALFKCFDFDLILQFELHVRTT